MPDPTAPIPRQFSAPLGRRCKAKLPRGEYPAYWGRCDLKRGHTGGHVLERGMEEIHWTYAAEVKMARSTDA